MPKALRFALRFGTAFSQFSIILILVGINVLIRGAISNAEALPIGVALILVGPVLLYISLYLSNRKIELLQKGKTAVGTFKEWKNSFMELNNRVMVYLVYTYFDDRRKKKEAHALSTSTNGYEKVHVFYNDERSVVFEYLPGKPFLTEENEVEVGILSIIARYSFIFVLAIGSMVSAFEV